MHAFDVSTLTKFRELADSLGLSSFVEAHDEKEVQMAIDCGARIIGVNNRNLKDFTVDVQNSVRLRNLVQDDVIFVSESGLETPEDIQVLRDNNIGVALMGKRLCVLLTRLKSWHIFMDPHTTCQRLRCVASLK